MLIKGVAILDAPMTYRIQAVGINIVTLQAASQYRGAYRDAGVAHAAAQTTIKDGSRLRLYLARRSSTFSLRCRYLPVEATAQGCKSIVLSAFKLSIKRQQFGFSGGFWQVIGRRRRSPLRRTLYVAAT